MYNSSTSCFLLVPGTYWDMLLIILCKCILSVYTLLKVVSYYDLGVLSKSVMVSKKSWF